MNILFSAIFLFMVSGVVHAVDVVDLQSCASVSDDSDRLACFDKLAADDRTESKAEEKTDIDRDAVLKYFKSDDEPTVKDATWTSPDTFKVGVLDKKGRNRDGFAEYVCGVLISDFKAPGVWVQVIDIEKLINDDEWVKLGESRCAK